MANGIRMVVAVKGIDISYGTVGMTADVVSTASGIEVSGYEIRTSADRFSLDDVPLGRMIPKSAKDDAVFHTFEQDEPDRLSHVEVDFEVIGWDESFRIHLRAVESNETKTYLVFEVEDDSGDWLAIENLLFSDLMSEGFRRALDAATLEKVGIDQVGVLRASAWG